MRFPSRAEALAAPPWLLFAAGVALQWLSTLTAATWSDGDEPLSDPVVLLNVVALAPLALGAGLMLARRLGGPAFGPWLVLLWLGWPWVLVSLALSSYETVARHEMLPLLLGLTSGPGFAAGALILTAAALIAVPGVAPAAAAGASFGIAALLVPGTLAFAVAAATALALEWRPRVAAAFGAALLPFLLALALWRGWSTTERTGAALAASLDGFREYFWSERLLEWLPLAGMLGVARRSVALAVFLGGGFIGFALLQGARVDSGFESAAIFRILLPGLPAYVVLVAAIPLLVPTLAARLRAQSEPS